MMKLTIILFFFLIDVSSNAQNQAGLYKSPHGDFVQINSDSTITFEVDLGSDFRRLYKGCGKYSEFDENLIAITEKYDLHNSSSYKIVSSIENENATEFIVMDGDFNELQHGVSCTCDSENGRVLSGTISRHDYERFILHDDAVTFRASFIEFHPAIIPIDSIRGKRIQITLFRGTPLEDHTLVFRVLDNKIQLVEIQENPYGLRRALVFKKNVQFTKE